MRRRSFWLNLGAWTERTAMLLLGLGQLKWKERGQRDITSVLTRGMSVAPQYIKEQVRSRQQKNPQMRFPVVKVMTESMLVAYVEGKRASPRPAKRRALPWASNSEYVQVPIVGWILQPSSGMSKQLFVFRAEEDELERRSSYVLTRE